MKNLNRLFILFLSLLMTVAPVMTHAQTQALTSSPTTVNPGDYVVTLPPALQQNLIAVQQSRLNTLQNSQANLSKNSGTMAAVATAVAANPSQYPGVSATQAGNMANAMASKAQTLTPSINATAAHLNALQAGPLTSQQGPLALPQPQ